VDLLNPSAESEKRKHKLKRLVQSPNSYFMDVKCPGTCHFNIAHFRPHHSVSAVTEAFSKLWWKKKRWRYFERDIDENGSNHSCVLGCFSIMTMYSHAQTVILCNQCSNVLCQPTGGRARLTEGLIILVICGISQPSLLGSSFRKKMY
jgi:small subunit ribosomal protein S27e